MTCHVPDGPAFVGCGVLEAEIRALMDECWPDCKLKHLSSMLHMRPVKLGTALESVLGKALEHGNGAVLIYGDCCPHMAALAERPGTARTEGVNCCELLLGHDEYFQLLREGAFFLLPEWARRWRKVFTTELGLDQTNAASFMQDMHTKLVYLDTGIVPVPEENLKDCAEFVGLPYEIRPTPLDNLKTALEEALGRVAAWRSAK